MNSMEENKLRGVITLVVSLFFVIISLYNILKGTLYRIPIFIDYKKANDSYIILLLFGLIFTYFSFKKVFKK